MPPSLFRLAKSPVQIGLSEFQIIFQSQSNNFLSLAICLNSCQGVVASAKRFFLR